MSVCSWNGSIMKCKNVCVTTTAVNRLTSNPSASVTAKPRTAPAPKLVPKAYSTAQIMIVEKFESRIERCIERGLDAKAKEYLILAKNLIEEVEEEKKLTPELVFIKAKLIQFGFGAKPAYAFIYSAMKENPELMSVDSYSFLVNGGQKLGVERDRFNEILKCAEGYFEENRKKGDLPSKLNYMTWKWIIALIYYTRFIEKGDVP